MATSATIYSRWDTSGTPYNLYRFYLSWQLSSTDIVKNQSLIKWQAGVEIANSGYLGSNSTKINSVHIDGGSSLASGTWSGISGNGKHQLKSGSKPVDHNADGTKTFSADMSGWFIDDGTFAASGSWTLPTIPRNSQVSTNDSGHYDLGTALTIYTNRKSTSFTHTITIRMDNSSGTVLQTINSVGASTVWTPTSDQITTMQNHIPAANSLKLYIDQYNNQVKEHSNVTVTSYLRDANPTFTTFTYKDSDTTTAGITGNNQVLVKGKSVLEVDVSATNKMTALKGSSADHYAFAYDGSSELEDYSATATVSASFSNPQTIGNRTIQVSAYDSRNNSTTVSQNVTVYDYVPPTITTTLTRENNFGSNTTVHIEGTYTPLVIGGANKNSLTTSTLQYRYQEDLGTFGSWVTKTFTANTTDGTFSVTDFVVSLDNTKKYNFEFHINDKFGQVTTTNSVDVGTPIMFIGQNSGSAAVGINKMPENGALDVEGDIYSNGIKVSVDTPKPAFFASKTSGGNLAANTYTAFTSFATPDYDIGSNFNASTGIFTAPIAGIYNFTMSVYSNSGYRIGIIPKKNDSSFGKMANSTANVVVSSRDVYLGAGDTLQMQAYSYTGTSVFIGEADSTYFCGHLVTPD